MQWLPDPEIVPCSDPDGQVMGRFGPEGRPVVVTWQAGRVVSVTPAESPPTDAPWLLPGLFDLQVNGFQGVDFQAESLSEEQLETAVWGLRRWGCSGCFPTLITDEWPRMMSKLERLVSLRARRSEWRYYIKGFHLEGPFLSPEAGFRGAHPANCMLDANLDLLKEMLSVAGDVPLLVTVAPERPGVIEWIEAAVRQGVRVSLGHSAATRDEVQRAIEAGATGITHWGNGLPQELPRHDNWFWSIMDSSRLFVGLIPDGIHLPAPVFRGMHHALSGRHNTYYTTDAMAAAGAGPGIYPLGQERLEVGADEIVRQPGRPNFAGSALAPLKGIARAAQMLNESWLSVWPRFSDVPRRFLGLSSELKVGIPWDFCRICVDECAQPRRITVYTPTCGEG